MLKSKDLFEKTCTRCNKIFKTDKEGAYVCPTCQKENTRSYRSKIREREKSIKKQAPTGLPLDVIKAARIVDKYNREHGTNYSYGKFVEAVKMEKLKFKR